MWILIRSHFASERIKLKSLPFLLASFICGHAFTFQTRPSKFLWEWHNELQWFVSSIRRLVHWIVCQSVHFSLACALVGDWPPWWLPVPCRCLRLGIVYLPIVSIHPGEIIISLDGAVNLYLNFSAVAIYAKASVNFTVCFMFFVVVHNFNSTRDP